MAKHLPEYNVVINNRAYRVELAKKEAEGLFYAKVNSKPVEFELKKGEVSDAAPITIMVSGKEYRIEIGKVDRHCPFTLKVNDAVFKAELAEPMKRAATQMPTVQMPARKREAAEEGAVVAPMAGKIVTVNVKNGDRVKVGEVLCILEAMKMENEISATRAGTVHQIKVGEGASVNDGEVLMVIK